MRDDSTHSVKVRFLARSVPAIGYKMFHIASTIHPRSPETTLKANRLAFENEYPRLEVDPGTGCVTRLVNKKDGENILRLETFVDKPGSNDVWDIGWPYDQTRKELFCRGG